jgi:hypothetical protein
MRGFIFHQAIKMRARRILCAAGLALASAGAIAAAPVSDATEDCIGCHTEVTPGIVADWRGSRMAKVTPAEALQKRPVERRISVQKPPAGLADTVVGCAECHTMNLDRHADTFEHNGYRVHIVVTPEDCATCHPVVRAQYAKNLMANAYGNLYDSLENRWDFEAVPWVVGKDFTAPTCATCHFAKLDRTIETTNAMTLAATRILLTAWDQGLAKGLAQNDSIFNEAIEQKWVSQWLFYANSTRFASAMGGADYGVFANGRYHLSSNLQEMADWLKFLRGSKGEKP